jgi:hypothetical protein
VAPGIFAPSFSSFLVYASFGTRVSSTNTYAHFEFRFMNDATTPIEVDRTSFAYSGTEARQVRGLSFDDYWLQYRWSATHVERGAFTKYGYGLALDGGDSDPWNMAVFPRSADEAWIVGYPMAIHRWSRLSDGGTEFRETADPSPWPRVYLNDVYVTPSGDVYAVGGNSDSNAGQSEGVIFREDGTPVGAPSLIDTWYDDGFNSIDGTGEQIYVLHRSNSQQLGTILARGADGGFDIVYTARFRLARLDVEPSGEVWAVGAIHGVIVYFDGGTWAEHTLPSSEFRSTVSWENVAATPQGIILSGFEVEPDGGRAAVVNTYRRFGQ